MLGLINKGFQCFVTDTQGESYWQGLMAQAGLNYTNFEALLHYPDDLIFRLLDQVAEDRKRQPEDILEDFGTYMVSHETTEPLRRLMRFSGVNFLDFVGALPDLPPRVRMAMPDVVLPNMEVDDTDDGFLLSIGDGIQGMAHVMLGLVRAMADDYGALVALEVRPCTDPEMPGQVHIQVFDSGYTQARDFNLVEAANG